MLDKVSREVNFTNVVMWVDFRFVYFKGDTLFMIWVLTNIGWDLVMWVDFFFWFHFMMTLLLRVGILAIYGENLRKIPTGHKLNQMVK